MKWIGTVFIFARNGLPERGVLSMTPSFVWFMVFNATFNNISVISWQSVLLVEETGAPEENHQPAASHLQTSLHNIVVLPEWDSNPQR